MLLKNWSKSFIGLGCLLGTLSAQASLSDGRPNAVELDQAGFKIDGKYTLLRGGTIQWFRLPEGDWADRLKRFKAAGFNTVDMYVAWNQIEKEESVFDFESPNIRYFLELCRELGLYVYFRPGPYITNEMDGGGVPGWLLDRTTKKSTAADGKVNLRTDDPDYLAYVDRYLGRLNEVIKPYLATNGGPIVLYSVENEYNWFETFHEVDKLFWYEGGPERDLLATFPTRNYFTQLRNIVRGDGIDVPLTTCPGDGKASATGDVAGIIPMPNVYNGLGGELPEKVAYDLLQDIHNSANHGGEYANFPSGTTETDRDPVRIKRMFMGGFDAAFAFNIAGYHQEGYMNATVLDINGDTAAKVFDFSKLNNIITGFVSPTVGYFHNVVDFNGAISPSALLRDSYYDFRRDNLFFDTVEAELGSSTHARRSGQVSNTDPRLIISNSNLGAIEDTNRIHYWHETPNGAKFINLVNQSGDDQTIATNGIQLDNHSFPRFSSMILKPENNAGPGQFGSGDDTSAAILVADYPVSGVGQIDYTTSEILTLRNFNADQLLVVYGARDTQGEIQFGSLSSEAKVIHLDSNITVNENENGTLNLSYQYAGYGHAVIQVGNQTLRILVTDKQRAGRIWFTQSAGNDLVIAGPDYIDQDSVLDTDSGFRLTIDHDTDVSEIMVMAPAAFDASDDLSPRQTFNELTLAAVYMPPSAAPAPTLADDLLRNGKARSDSAESQENYDASQWTNWSGDPQSAESLGQIKGHMWYRAELELTGWNWLPWWEPTDLYVEHASDIVGIYVNGTYLTTMVPLGTELDSDSWNTRYQYPSLRPYLKKGKNVIAFRVETWGHGSFMFPRGTLDGTTARIPSVGFDSEKGLFGEAKVGWRQLEKWSMRADLNGQIQGYSEENFDDSQWPEQSFPSSLPKGDVYWYRTSFDTAVLPNPASNHAPVVLALEGSNAKATIYVNGHLIGRWLSDSDWLSRGFWGRATRDMWMNTNPDHFPVSRSILNPPGENNTVSIIFEDTSSDVENPGRIDKLQLEYAQENAGESANKTRTDLGFSWL